MTTLSNLVNNLSEIYKKECKGCKEKIKIKSICNFIRLKNNKLNYKCKECKKRWLKPVNELIKKFPNMHQFCNGDNKFVLLLREGVYPYETLPDKGAFYSELYLEDNTDKEYTHAQKVFKELGLKNLGDYLNLYVQSNILLLADVFENFRNKCIEIYELDPAHFLSAPGLAWQACLKKTEVKFNLLTKIDMLLMAGKGIWGKEKSQ